MSDNSILESAPRAPNCAKIAERLTSAWVVVMRNLGVPHRNWMLCID